MSIMGKLTSLPSFPMNWNRVQDQYGNSWDIKAKDVKGKSAGDQVAFRLDFSDPLRNTPQAMATSDD